MTISATTWLIITRHSYWPMFFCCSWTVAFFFHTGTWYKGSSHRYLLTHFIVFAAIHPTKTTFFLWQTFFADSAITHILKIIKKSHFKKKDLYTPYPRQFVMNGYSFGNGEQVSPLWQVLLSFGLQHSGKTGEIGDGVVDLWDGIQGGRVQRQAVTFVSKIAKDTIKQSTNMIYALIMSWFMI